MALVNLQTNLKSLRYGKDRVGGGSSGQPYVTSSPPDSLSDLGRSGGIDFLLRGGTLMSSRTLDDVSRLTKMFTDLKSPNGLLFTAKQNVLSRTSVPIDGKGKTLNNGVYLPTSTLLQSVGNPLGLHLNKQGIDPFKGIGKNGGGIFEIFGGSDPLGQPTYTEITTSPTYKSKLENFTISKINSKTTNTELFSYQGGPGSNLGIGKTIISLSKDRTGINNPNLNFITGSFELGSSYIESKYTSPTDRSDITLDLQTKLGTTPKFLSLYPETKSSITDKWSNNNVGTNLNDKYRPDKYYSPTQDTPSIQEDFRIINNPNITRISYIRKNIEQRVNLGNPGKRLKDTSSYTKGLGTPLDKINALALYKSELANDNGERNDLVTFRIGVIDNENPKLKTYIHFRAFIDSFSDNYSSQWDATKYMGRGEKMYKYSGFDRNISMGWTVAAQSKEELIPMYKKLNYLASSLTPDYSDIGYMRGNLVTLTVGGYLYEQTGIITGLNYSIPENSPWEIAIKNEGGRDNSVKELSHIIKVTGFNFIPIHNFVPKVQKLDIKSKESAVKGEFVPSAANGDFGAERYISLANGYNRGNNNYDRQTKIPVISAPATFNVLSAPVLTNINQLNNG